MKLNIIIKRHRALITVSLISLLCQLALAQAEVYMANGIKIGEVDSNSAIIWTRLTQNPERVRSGNHFIKMKNFMKSHQKSDGMEQIPEGLTLAEMDGAVPGRAGEVRVHYWPKSRDAEQQSTGWEAVAEGTDFVRQFRLTGLEPWTRYQLKVEGRLSETSDPTAVVAGEFITAPAEDHAENIRFTVVTCGDYNRRDNPEMGHVIYETIVNQIQPHFFVHTGDIEYYDKENPWAPSVPLARFKMNRLYSMPNNRKLHNTTASYFMKDDHDITLNDAWPGKNFGTLTWQQGLDIFNEQFPMGDKPYRTIRWGKDLQVWLVEGRNYRSPNRMKDGPDKTIWGEEQKQWFFDTVNQSDATFKVLISPTPIVGPDRNNKNDNHANKGFKHEGDEIRQFIAKHANLFIANGDRHWQYHSIDDETGVREFSCGPHSDIHAGGYKENKTSEHQFLRVKGGFLSVEVSREEGAPEIVFRHHDVQGSVVHEERFTN